MESLLKSEPGSDVLGRREGWGEVKTRVTDGVREESRRSRVTEEEQGSVPYTRKRSPGNISDPMSGLEVTENTGRKHLDILGPSLQTPISFVV